MAKPKVAHTYDLVEITLHNYVSDSFMTKINSFKKANLEWWRENQVAVCVRRDVENFPTDGELPSFISNYWFTSVKAVDLTAVLKVLEAGGFNLDWLTAESLPFSRR